MELSVNASTERQMLVCGPPTGNPCDMWLNEASLGQTYANRK